MTIAEVGKKYGLLKCFIPMFIMGLLVIQIVHPEEDTIMNDGNIQRPDENFSLGLNIKFNFLGYGSQDTTLISNSPVFLGLSFSYKDYGASFSIAQSYTYVKTPGKHTAFDVNLAFYQYHWFEELSVKFYDDFLENDQPFGMEFISGNLQGGYIFNADNFSLQSAYTMNRIQKSSAGSLIAGGNIRLSTIKSNDIEYYNNRNWLINLGPNIGYSYTFVSKKYLFLNMFLLCGANVGINCNKPSVLFSPYIVPKIAIGKHNKTWSINFVLEVNFLAFVSGERQEYFNYDAATLGFVKRF